MSVWATLFMACRVKDENGLNRSPAVTRAIQLPGYLPIGTALILKNSVDDPFSPDIVTIKAYTFMEGDNQPTIDVDEVSTDTTPITRGGFTAMARDGGWGVDHW